MKFTSSFIVSLFISAVAVLCFQVQDEDPFYTNKRRLMVETLLHYKDITDKKVLDVLGRIPRHLFIGNRFRHMAYEDTALPIEEGQTISQPYIVALMTQCLELDGSEKVLEIGTGSGYQAAVLSFLADRVFSIEINPRLAKKAEKTLHGLGYSRIRVKTGDGFFGWPDEAPFDAIIVTCAAPKIPGLLIEQLKEGGRLIIPIGKEKETQVLTLFRKIKGKSYSEQISYVRFVPMTGTIKK